MNQEPTHLWEVTHPYAGPHAMYHATGHENAAFVHEHETWADFAANGEFGPDGGLDPDLNWLYRWDWHEHDDQFEDENVSTLELFFLLPRKGILSHTRITGMTPADEPAVRQYLAPFAVYMATMWAPFLTVKEA